MTIAGSIGPWRLHPDSIPGLALAHAGDRPEALALAQGGNGPERLTWRELAEHAAAVASLLRARGVARGDRVILYSENRPAWGATYLGILARGAVAVPLDALLGPDEIAPLVAHSDARVAFVSKTLLPRLVQAAPSGGPEHLFCLDGPDPQSGAEGLAGALAAAEPGDGEDGPRPDDPAVIIYTSGTTGKPKGVVLLHRNITSNIRSALAVFTVTAADSFLSVLPLHHTLECTGGLLLPLSSGARVTYARSLKSRELLEDLAGCRATVLIGVPLLYEKMYQGIKRAMDKAPPARRALLGALGAVVNGGRALGLDLAPALFRPIRAKAGLDHIRFFVSGAAALAGEVFLGFRDLGIGVIEGYGLTEASPVLSLNPPGRQRLLSVGPALPGVTIEIRDADEAGVGEIWAKGPNVMAGYLDNPAATDEVLVDGWLRTGDVGRLDAQGYLYITGRAKSLIVSAAGKNIYPEEIEAEIEVSPYVAEVLVVPRTDPRSGREEVHAIVFPDFEAVEATAGVGRDDAAAVESLLRQEVTRLTERLADYKRVKGITVRDEEFPKTSTKKIKRFLFQ
jgi:long-chain acyl-CoA synthetase